MVPSHLSFGAARLPRKESYSHQPSTDVERQALVTPGPGIRLCPLTQNYCSPPDERADQCAGYSLDSQEDLFSSQEDSPALKKQRTATSYEGEDIQEMVGSGQLVNCNAAESEELVTEGNRSTDDEEEALPLTFHTKEDLIRKLHGIQQIPRGKYHFGF